MSYQEVSPDFYAHLIENISARADGNYYIENTNGFPWTGVKIANKQITAQDFTTLNDAMNWLQNTARPAPATPASDGSKPLPEHPTFLDPSFDDLIIL